MVLPPGVAQFRHTLVRTLEAEQTQLTPLGQERFHQRFEAFGRLDKAVASDQETLEALAPSHPVCQRLQTLPGSGPLPATALSAAVSEAQVCKNGRQVAAWGGVVPKPYATGGQTRVLGIRKRGDSSLRKLLIQGARAPLRWARTQAERRSQWIRGLLARRGWNRTAVAVATKHARIVGA
jgi:transposase